MNSATARRVEDFQRRQSNELRELDRRQGRAPSLGDLRRINDLKTQHELLFKNLELTLPEQRGDDNASSYEARLLTALARHSPTWRRGRHPGRRARQRADAHRCRDSELMRGASAMT